MANGRAGGKRRGSHASSAQTFKKDSFGVTFSGPDIAELHKALEKGIQEKVLRSAARAGIDVFYKEIRLRVPFATGKLYESIYQWHDDKQSKPTRQVYATGPNKRKAPHWHWVEYGNIRMAKQPYIRPAYLGKLEAAHQAARARMSERMRELLAELKK